jgi:aryl-alcohol dehydrogenase-like predicted oxidoreductase
LFYNSFLTGKYTRESVKSESRGHSIENHAKSEKNWKILDEVIAISKEIERSPVQVII